ncbi:DUF6544 family protein [Sungkyunkwania multivorans]|uniref:DUF6544 family protein n=1 Tax=Sungkyunkwania multivorans TaxID=1173618 RepID=A0ABW3D472_9FLAO
MLAVIFIIIITTIVIILFYGMAKFNFKVAREKERFFNKYGTTEKQVMIDDLDRLPLMVQNYLKQVGVLGRCRDCHVIFKQRGKIRAKPEAGWKHFAATQYMTSVHPGFIWKANVFPMFIRDKSIEGQGEMTIDLFGLTSIGVFKDERISQSALGRCLGELVCCPMGFLSRDISWEKVNDMAIRATLSYENTVSSGVFFFNGEGLIERFESMRYKDEKLVQFIGKYDEYSIFNGLKIPTKMTGIWNFPTMDFEYFNARMTHHNIE